MSNTEFTARKLANVDRAAADERLSHLDFRLLWLLASAADRKTGIARRKQSDLAEMLGVHRRTVQRCRDRLVSFGYLIPIGKKPGGNVSGYNIFTSKKAALVSPSEKGGAGAASDDGQGGAGVQRGGAGVQKGGPPTAPILPLKSLEIPCAPNHETEDGRPRSPDGRGPHPLGELEPGLRLALGRRFPAACRGQAGARRERSRGAFGFDGGEALPSSSGTAKPQFWKPRALPGSNLSSRSYPRRQNCGGCHDRRRRA